MMNEEIAFIFPGQGAQYPGMGKDFYDQFQIAKRTFEEADDLLAQKFSSLIFQGSIEELTLTKNSQLAIFITSIAIFRTLTTLFPELSPSICAGLSLGEYSALVAASKVSFKDCLFLVRERALAMHEASLAKQGSMQAVLGMDVEQVRDILSTSSLNVWIANLNCPGQVVISGVKSDLEPAAALLKQKGAKRCLPLEVSGAFHSQLMKPAQKHLEPFLHQVALHESAIDLIMNVTGNLTKTKEEIRKNLLDQVTHCVYWQKGIELMMQKQTVLYVEVGPGKTLQGMNRKIGVTSPTFSIEKVSDIELFSKHFEETITCNC